MEGCLAAAIAIGFARVVDEQSPASAVQVATRCAMREALMDHQLARSDSDRWVM
jgi:hypothetical protein